MSQSGNEAAFYMTNTQVILFNVISFTPGEASGHMTVSERPALERGVKMLGPFTGSSIFSFDTSSVSSHQRITRYHSLSKRFY